MSPPPPGNDLPRTRDAARLGAFARSLGCSVGVERSCKLSRGRVDAARFLLSYGADERTVGLTARLVGGLGAPEAVLAGFAEAAPRARFLHIGHEGHEGPGRAATLKVYCERDPEAGQGPLYAAWKWSPARPEAFAVDHYGLCGVVDGAAAATALEEALDAPDLARSCRTLLARAGEVMLLEVRRRGAARRSYDLRLYGSELSLADAADVIATAGAAFDLPLVALDPLHAAGDRPLGHLAGGRDDADAPFLTLYHGAEAFA